VSDPYLGTTTLMRAFLDAIWPDGSAHNPVPAADLDNFLSGLGDDLQAVFDFMGGLDDIRNPRTTPYLDELEREFGITPNIQLTDAQRRMTLLLVKYSRNHHGTINDLQSALDHAGLGAGGYGLTVYANDPPVDPSPFIAGVYEMYLGGPNQYLGYNTGGITRSYFGLLTGGGMWVVNGDSFVATPNYEPLGGTQSLLGYVRLGAPGGYLLGEYYSITYLPSVITSPADSWTWPMVFFIAGGVTRAYTNLIDRGDCESATPPAISGITTAYVSAGDTWAQSTDHAYNGTHSFKFTKNSGAGTAGYANLTDLDSGFYITPGHTYALTARFWIPSGQAGLVPSTMLSVNIGDGTGGQSVFAQDAYDSWQLLTWNHTVPVGAIKGIPRAFNTTTTCPACTVYVDDITLNDITYGPPISALSLGNIPGNMRQTLIEIIMRLKPVHTWAVLMSNFT
jgi:hypothetical protein